MKILKLIFQNINSLKGAQVIEFDKSPLSDSGLFLIAGPTGSGKSTILDVITLALYNQVPRFGTLSKNSIAAMGSILTHHTRDAYAEVHYSSNGKLYISKWSMAKNRNDNFNDYHMELFEGVDKKNLDLKKSEVPEANEKIIGLSYGQFVKSIMLSQGEFAQFLKANHDERSALLEKLTGTEIYRNLGSRVFNKHKECKEALDYERSILQMTSIFTNEEIFAFDKEVEEINGEVEENNRQIVLLNERKSLKTQYDGYKSQLAKLTEQHESLLSRAKDFAQYAERLKKHDDISHFRGELTQFKDFSELSSKLVLEDRKLKDDKNKLDAEKADYLVKVASLTKSEVSDSNFFSIVNEFETKIKNVNDELGRLKNDGINLRNETEVLVAEVDASYKKWYEEKISPEKAINLITEELDASLKFIGDNNVDIKSNISDLTDQISVDVNKVATIKNAIDIFNKYKILNNKIEEAKKSIATTNASIESLTKDKERIEKEVTEKNELIISLRNKKEQELQKAQLSDYRNKLKEGEACPLCGATSHPYCVDKIVVEVGSIEIQLHKEDAAFIQLQNSLLQNSKEISTLSERLQMLSKALVNDEVDAVQMYQQVENSLGSAENIGKSEVLLEELDAKIKKNNALLSAIDKIRILKPIQDKYVLLNKTFADFKKANDQLKVLSPSNTPLEDADRLKAGFHKVQEELIRVNTSLHQNASSAKENGAKLKELENRLANHLTPIGIASINEAFSYILHEEDANRLRKEHRQFVEDNSGVKNKIDQVKKDLAKISDPTLETVVLDELTTKLYEVNKAKDTRNQQKGIIQQKLKNNEENKQKMAKTLATIELLEKDLYKWDMLKTLIGDKDGKKFTAFAQELTLLQIIDLANHRLSSLTDRYQLTQKDNELFVIDLYLGNIERSVKTLSGGESFIMSLALALSLSDLASQNVRLDCLFVDEGFGTLDDEMLDTVISTLEKLQQESEKTIGIISHVESLKERIITQIVLHKNNQGISAIKISG